jgi:hypothetical protein
VICMSCKRDLPIHRFAVTPASKRSRRCAGCKCTATCNVKRWHKHGRECSRCGEVKPCPAQITDFPWRPAVCQLCQKTKERDRQREWAAQKRANDDDFRRRQIEATLRWQQRHPEYVIEAEHRRYAAIKADPERYERHKESARMRYRLRQQKAGRQIRPISEAEYEQRYGTARGKLTPRVPTAPLARLLRDVFDLEAVADAARLSSSFVGRVARGEYDAKGLTIRDADALCIALGTALTLVYPQAA